MMLLAIVLAVTVRYTCFYILNVQPYSSPSINFYHSYMLSHKLGLPRELAAASALRTRQ